jgi:predicted transcriptional regulator of viral defense system
MKHVSLKQYMDSLVTKGELIFSKEGMLNTLGTSDAAIRNSIKRQVANRAIKRLFRGYYLIIPLEFRQLGFVPPELFIDDLMQRQSFKYYVCLLSAAGYYGATHQSSQIFQVMVQKPLKPIKLGGAQINFYVNKNLEKIPIQNIKTDRGPLTTSSPEATCLDLLGYLKQSGNLNHIITVFEEMADAINPEKLFRISAHYPLISVQRLGYMMEKINCTSVSDVLESYLKLHKPKIYTLLSPDSPNKSGHKNSKWHLIINEKLESDL